MASLHYNIGHCQAFSLIFSAFAFNKRNSRSSAMCLLTIISANICSSEAFKRAILSATVELFSIFTIFTIIYIQVTPPRKVANLSLLRAGGYPWGLCRFFHDPSTVTLC